MLTDAQREKLDSCMNSSKFDSNTRKYVETYMEMNSQLFSGAVDVDTLIDNVSTNLSGGIKYDNFNPMLRGEYQYNKGKISINPLFRFISGKDRERSTVFHELDHCAVTKSVQYGEGEMNPMEQMLEKYKKVPIIRRFIPGLVKLYDKKVGQKFMSGIQNGIQNVALNEGITAYKQQKYEQYLGIDNNKSGYKRERDYARKIAEIIGEDNMIRCHANNSFEEMAEIFDRETLGVGNLESLNENINAGFKRVAFAHPIKALKARRKINGELKQCFVANRCKRLGIEYNPEYYKKLSSKELEIEIGKLDRFKGKEKEKDSFIAMCEGLVEEVPDYDRADKRTIYQRTIEQEKGVVR